MFIGRLFGAVLRINWIQRLLKMKSYLKHIYLWTAMAILLLMLLFSIVIYFNVEKTILENNYENNIQVLTQMEYNISSMDKIVTDFCMSVFMNPDAISIMNWKYSEDELYDTILKMDRIKSSSLSINSFVHSIYIYNYKYNTYYSTFNGIFYEDKLLEQVLKSYKTIPTLKPISRMIEKTDPKGVEKYENIFTYVMYDFVDSRNQPEGAVFINVRPQWILDNIKRINNQGGDKGDGIFLMDDKRDFIDNGDGDEVLKKSLKGFYTDKIEDEIKSGRNFDTLQARINGSDYFIAYIYIKSANWVILKTQSYKEVYRYVQKLKTSVVVITVIFLLASLFIAVTVSKRIYRPVGNLIREVSPEKYSSNDFLPERDEMGFLRDIYKDVLAKADLSQKERNGNREIFKTYYLRKLLVDYQGMSREELEKVREQEIISLDMDAPVVVCVVRIDNYRDFTDKYDSANQDLIRFAIGNIMTEVVSRHFKNDAIDMKNDQIVLLVNYKGPDFYNELTHAIREFQGYLLEYYKVSVSVAIGEKTENPDKIPDEYRTAFNYSMYRYVFGKMCILSSFNIKNNICNVKMDYSFPMESRLEDAIQSGSLPNIEDSLLSILSGICRLNYSNIMLSVMHLIATVKSKADEINQRRMEPFNTDFLYYSQSLLDIETIDELYTRIIRVLEEATGERKAARSEKNTILIDAVKEIVNTNYHSRDLSLAEIAGILKMSPAYTGRVFKENTHMSVADYINDVRMDKAAIWLENTHLGIHQVMEKVGIENESNFYRNFKKRFGVTPREYVFNGVHSSNPSTNVIK